MFDTLMATMLKTEYTRLPLYEGDINNIVGIFHIRKANHLLRSEHVTHNAIKRFSEEPYFIPDSTTLTNQLLNFKTTRNRFAVVVDEYGEVKGLVTLEDILEEIVGDFTTNTADGAATIREINKATNWSLPTDGPKTLNGLALEQLESIPDGNVSFIINGYRFETIELNGKMIRKVSAVRLNPEPVDSARSA